MTYLIYVGRNRDTGEYLSDKKISEIIDRHRTPTKGVVIKATEELLSGGFEVFDYDDTIEGIMKRFKDVEPYPETARDLAKQARIIREGAEITQDTSITKGEKPYKGKNNASQNATNATNARDTGK